MSEDITITVEDTSDIQQCTGELRFVRRPVFGWTKNTWPSVLQQRWVSLTNGKSEWKDVPTVLDE